MKRLALCVALVVVLVDAGPADGTIVLNAGDKFLVDGPGGQTITAAPPILGPVPATPTIGNMAFDPVTGDLLLLSSAGLFRHTLYTDSFVNTNLVGAFSGWNDIAFSQDATVIPEPSSLIVWSLILLTFGGVGWCRKRKAS